MITLLDPIAPTGLERPSKYPVPKLLCACCFPSGCLYLIKIFFVGNPRMETVIHTVQTLPPVTRTSNPLTYVTQILYISFLFFSFFPPFWPWGGRGEREGEKDSQAGSMLSIQPDVGLDLTPLKSWPDQKSRVGCLTEWATQVPQILYVSVNFFWYDGYFNDWYQCIKIIKVEDLSFSSWCSNNFCFAYFDAILFETYKYRLVVPYW